MKKLLLVVPLMVGCVGVPQTKIDLRKGTFSSPKDDTFKNVSVEMGTNGVTKLHIGQAGGSNNPAVIEASANGQQQIINAYSAMITAAFQAGMQMAATMMGVPIPKLTIPQVPIQAPPSPGDK